MVKDLISNTINNIQKYKIKSIKNVYNCSETLVGFSNKFKKIEKEIKFFLRLKMYNNKNVLLKNNKGKKIVRHLFNEISKKPNKFFNKAQVKKNKFRTISDYIAGMTDRYAINLYNNLK
jgi:dGTPase